nr:MAG TPA: endonuclease [Caudoviricetes sp.]
MILTYKTRLEPNNKQAGKFKQFVGAARYAYNWAVSKEKEAHELGNAFIGDAELRRLFTKHKADNAWLYEISNEVTKQAIKDAVIAFSNFFKGKADFPHFKIKKKSKPTFYQDVFTFKASETHIKLEKIADSTRKNRKNVNWIKLSEKGRIPIISKGYQNPRITLDGIHWYVSVGVEVPEKTTEPTNDGIGIDLGIKDLAICSDKNTYKNINKTDRVKRLEKQKRRKQREISRKYEKNKDGDKYVKTKNTVKAELALLKLNHKLTDIRKNYIHQVTNEIISRKPKFIILEDLNVKDMMRNRHLAKAIQQQNMAEFARTLEYKAKQNNIEVIYVDRFYPSSKTCSCCGAIKHDLKLKDRTFKCNSCGLVIDRDYNASLNLYQYYDIHTARSAGIYVCGVSHQTAVVSTKQNTMKQKLNINLFNRFYKI